MSVRLFEEGATVTGMLAEHGFSALVSVRRGDRTHTLLFDTGVSPGGMADDMERLALERRQPSLLLDDSVLITGEVDRTTDFEQGMPYHEAQRDGRWEPDPLILDDQALV
ncbi:MAG TPA: hypothetical protein VIZ67_01925, partial [Acidimicrobiales bacterium]